MGPKRQRNSMFLYVSNLLGTFEVNVAYKTTKTEIQALSANKFGDNFKLPFGPPTTCEYLVRNKNENVFKFTNQRKQTVAMKDTLLNNLQFGVNDFSRKVTALTTGGKNKLLALYLSLINKSESFIHHRPGVHDNNGDVLSAAGEEGTCIVDNGGSVEEYQQFLKIAKESAAMVDSPAVALKQIINKFQSNRKRKSCDSENQESGESSSKAPRLSKVETVKNNERKELEDEDGLEMKYQDSFCGVAHIPLDNISVPPQMQLSRYP